MVDVRILRWGYLYAIAALISGLAGYYSWPPRLVVSQITLASVPETPADQEWSMQLFTTPEKYQLSSEDMVLITEKGGFAANPKDEMQTRYLCPRKADTWGEVIYRFPLEGSKRFRQAILDLDLHVFTEFDPLARGELWITSDKAENKWKLLVELNASKSEQVLEDPIDVTQWASGAKHLDVRLRLKAHRLMYHPTPNDPIGFAAAQCLRTLPVSTKSLRLRVWR